jgi:hypothetical protein
LGRVMCIVCIVGGEGSEGVGGEKGMEEWGSVWDRAIVRAMFVDFGFETLTLITRLFELSRWRQRT